MPVFRNYTLLAEFSVKQKGFRLWVFVARVVSVVFRGDYFAGTLWAALAAGIKTNKTYNSLCQSGYDDSIHSFVGAFCFSRTDYSHDADRNSDYYYRGIFSICLRPEILE